jgi:hypothetical protein
LAAGVLLLALSVSAHDPYEITSTARLKADQIELQIEMEFPTSMLLAGLDPAAAGERSPGELFKSHLPQLEEQAGRFFQITAGNNPLRAGATNVTLEVENHVHFRLVYPPTELRPIVFAAPGLQTLSGHGPFGTTLTVLDLVHQRVLGQEVLFADSPALALGAEAATPTAQIAPAAPVAAPESSMVSGAPTQAVPVAASAGLGRGRGLWHPFGIAAAVVVILGALWSCARRRQA